MKNILSSALLTLAACASASPASSGNPVVGYMGYSDSQNFEAGLYSIDTNGATRIWADQLFVSAGLSLNTGWYRDGLVCGFYPFYYLGELISVIYAATDMTTGQVVDFQDRDIRDGAFEIAAYNPDDDYIYGYGFDASGRWQFMKAPASNPFAAETIIQLPSSAENQICSSMTWSAHDHMLIGVNADNRLVSIAPNGHQETLMQLNRYSMNYITGLWRNDADGKFWWNAILREPGALSDVSYILTADPKTQTQSEIYEFEEGEEFMFMFQASRDLNPNAPLSPSSLEAVPAGASSEAQVSFNLPSSAAGGSPLSGQLDWRLLVDGRQTLTGSGLPGSAVSQTLASLSNGLHQLTVYVSLPSGVESDAASSLFYIGIDTPAAPANVVLTASGVSWDAVNTGEHGGWVDPSSISYDLWINGAFECNTQQTSRQLTIPTSGPMQSYIAKVVAKSGSLTSRPAYSNTLVEGEAMSLPAVIGPTADQAALCSVADEDGDGYTWGYNQTTSSFESTYNEDFPTDDWLFLPPMAFDDSEVYYRISLSASCLAPEFTKEFLEVRLGSAPDAQSMTQTIMASFQPDSKEMATYSGYFMVPAPGNAYIGLHAISYPDQYGMSVKNIRVEKTGVTPSSPSAPELLSLQPASGGKATLSFRLPTTTVGGTALPAGASLECRVSCAGQTASASGTPGSEISLQIKVNQGWNDISASAWFGDMEGLPLVERRYIGADIPASVSDLLVTADRDMMGASMSWTAPTVGFNGGTIDPGQTSYQIYLLIPGYAQDSWQLVDETRLTSYKWKCPDGMQQSLLQLGVLARNGQGDSGRVVAQTLYLGTPYTLPVDEDFEDLPNLSCQPYIIYTPDNSYTASWGFGDLDEYLGVGDGNGIIADTNMSDSKGRLGLPRFSTLGMENVSATFGIWSGSDAANISILAETYDEDEPRVIASNAQLTAWEPLTFELPAEYLRQPWVQLYVEALFPTRLSFVAISDFSISGTLGVSRPVSEGSLTAIPFNGGLRLRSDRPMLLDILTPAGLKIASLTLDGEETINLPKGIYIICAEGTALKVSC